jgi:hypothetical protein
MDGGVYAGCAKGARSGREGGATRHTIGTHAAPAFVEDQPSPRLLLLVGRAPRPPHSHAKRHSHMTAHGVVSWGTVAAWQTMKPLARSRYALPK